MFWALIKDSTVGKVLLLLVYAALLWWFDWYLAGGFLLLLFADSVVLSSFAARYKGDYIYSKEIQQLFSTDGNHLRVGMDIADVNSIDKISLFQQDQRGYIDFRLNSEMQVRYKFPLPQYQPLLHWLQLNLPDAEIITGLRS